MIIDTSAILVILCGEAGSLDYIQALAPDTNRLVSAPTMIETSIVCLKRFGEVGLNELDLFAYKAGLKIIPFDDVLYNLARKAFAKYGKGISAAGLNFGDCFTYALAKYTGEAILAKDPVFASTDIRILDVED